MTLLECFRLATLGTKREIEELSRSSRGLERAFLGALVRQYEGDVDGAVSALRHQFRSTRGVDKAVVAEFLAPILVMRHEYATVEDLAGVIEAAGFNASAHSLRALAAAEEGLHDVATREAALTQRALSEECDPLVRARALHRIARTMYVLQRYEEALDVSASSSVLCLQSGIWRTAAANYSIAFNVHYSITGQHEAARQYADLWLDAATRAGDDSFTYSALVAAHSLAVQAADDDRVQFLQRQIQLKRLPQQYLERFPYALSYAVYRGASDLVHMRTLLQVLRDTPGRTRGQQSLCASLTALAYAALLEDDQARAEILEATSRLGRSRDQEPAHEQFNRRLSRATIATTCVLLGEDVRAHRVMSVREFALAREFHDVPALVRNKRWGDFPPCLRGLARVYAGAVESREGLSAPAGLTRAEFEVLHLLGRGWSAGRIAIATARSVNTVYSHTRSILGKLEASRAPEAVAIARSRGYIT